MTQTDRVAKLRVVLWIQTALAASFDSNNISEPVSSARASLWIELGTICVNYLSTLLLHASGLWPANYGTVSL